MGCPCELHTFIQNYAGEGSAGKCLEDVERDDEDEQDRLPCTYPIVLTFATY